jgi:hypothetical protein
VRGGSNGGVPFEFADYHTHLAVRVSNGFCALLAADYAPCGAKASRAAAGIFAITLR